MVELRNQQTLADTLRSGLARRARALWRRWARGGPEFPAEAALDWLIAALGDSPSELRAVCRETLLDYGCADIVASWAEVVSSVEAPVASDRVLGIARKGIEGSKIKMLPSSVDLARAASHWYRRREVELAEAAFLLLEARQTPGGDFPSPPALFPDESPRDRVLTVQHYLDAAQMRVCSAFEMHGQELPHTIDPRDGRTIAVCDWMASLPPATGVADVGCGSGRFLIHLADRFPHAKLTGVDPCSALLDRLPPSVCRHRGTLLRTNLDDATVDAAFAVESLEHCLVAQRGIAELCRIVRPGGRVLVIDKRRSKQALSECEPWERWFHPHELTDWLEPFCNEIRVEPVSHSEGLGGKGLFLAASGTRLAATKMA
jgi:malonyl-CoA O-methyltransferase